jgi:hypothetical protein
MTFLEPRPSRIRQRRVRHQRVFTMVVMAVIVVVSYALVMKLG